nr:hypothetical protein [Tanacetum cinerariifolium]
NALGTLSQNQHRFCLSYLGGLCVSGGAKESEEKQRDKLPQIHKGKRPLRVTTHVEPTDHQRTEAEQLKLVLKRSRQETHISQQQSGSGTGEGTGSKPGVPDVPSDASEEELSWKSSDDE